MTGEQQDYLDAYWFLCDDRGMAIGGTVVLKSAIPLSEIILYAELKGFYDVDALVTIIRRLDTHYLTAQHDKTPPPKTGE